MSQEDVILIKNIYLSKQYGARRLLSELPGRGWKLGSIRQFAEQKPIVRQPGSGRPRLSRSSDLVLNQD